MAPQHDDDLFKDTAMTFGEHLEELRASLFKALIALVIGFSIGLIFAPRIVQWIQSPLEDALRQFYSEEAMEHFNKLVPPELRDNESVKHLVFEEGLQPELLFVTPSEMLDRLKEKYPRSFQSVELPKSGAKAPGNTRVDVESLAKADPPRGTEPPPVTVPVDSAQPLLTKDDMIPIVMWHKLSDDERMKVKNFNVQESFMIYIKAAFLAGALISSPFVFYFLWSFVAAGLYPHEKRYIHLFLPVSVGLFLSGAALAFFFVFPPVLNFFFGITKSMGQGLEPRISEWLSFVLLLPLGFGISFQLPLLMLFLERIHVFTVELYLAKWRIAVLLMAVMSMVLSPGGDPYSMLMMLVPLVALYFGGIALCHYLPSDRGPGGPGRGIRSLAGAED